MRLFCESQEKVRSTTHLRGKTCESLAAASASANQLSGLP
jgi:hypothetical protein